MRDSNLFAAQVAVGSKIESESMRIIEEELGHVEFDEKEKQILFRVIHATGDFEFAKNIRFHKDAIDAGIRSIRSKRPILVDVGMVEAGVNKALLKHFNIELICSIKLQGVRSLAQEKDITKAEAAIHLATQTEDIGIVAIGNAPTALLKVIQAVDGQVLKPELVVGVPVGFVKAAESKELLMDTAVPYITCIGRKGGSPVAVAVLNALLRLAL